LGGPAVARQVRHPDRPREYTIEGGVTEDEDGQFVFALRAVQKGDDWRLSFAGSVHFIAHHGLLDILIMDPELVIGPEVPTQLVTAGVELFGNVYPEGTDMAPLRICVTPDS
jgi:hypothetical protein